MRPATILTGMALAALLNTASAEEAEQCTRGEPVPVFNARQSGVSTHHFVTISSHEAQETVTLKTGEVLDIHHGGCEYFVTTFRIRSAQLATNVKSRADAYRAAAASLRRLLALKDESLFDLALVASTLEAAARRNPLPKFEEQLEVDGDGEDFLQTQVKLDAAGLASGKGFVQVTLFKGPL